MANTEDQQKAIDTIDRNVSVSAGAGSGKTAVLKQRFLNILEQSKKKFEATKGKYEFSSSYYDGVMSSNIVGITFTRKAAGEIKSRIRQEMLDAMNKGDVSFWRMQLADLERAQINTIHGLCARILRDNPVEANLDPNFAIAEDGDYEIFKEEVILRFIRKKLSVPEDNSVKAITDIIGASMLRSHLSELVTSLEDILNEGDLTEKYRESSACVQKSVEELKNQLKYLATERDNLIANHKTKQYEALEGLWSKLPELCADLDEYNFASTKVALKFTAKEKLKEERDIVVNMIGDIETKLVDEECIPVIAHWVNVLKEFHEFLTETKINENMLTYDDLETRAIALLRENEEIRHKYQKQYQYIMVDEFQDTNDKQCALIYLLCGDSEKELQGNKLFIVGDPKQSIYRFRGADVNVFTRVQKQIKASGGENISMKTNFRSKDTILDYCNETFDSIMGKESSSVDFEALDCADFNMDHHVSPELIKIEDASHAPGNLELVCVAQRILEAARKDMEAKKEAEKLGIKKDDKIYGNMAVLVRAMTHVNDLTQVLTDYNIPYVVIDGKGFYERQEVADIINLFDVLQDPYQNIPLAAILRSPYFGLDDEILTKVFLRADYGWDALESINKDGASEFDEAELVQLRHAVEKLMHLKTCVSYMDLSDIWQELWQTLDVEAVISLQKNGKQKLANIKKLRKISLEYIQKNYVGLAEWLEYVKNARAMEMRETNANLDAVDAVQIMTIHKSKGLEFKKVFIPFLGAKNKSDTRTIVYYPGKGLGIQIADANGNFVKTSVYKNIKEFDKDKEREERQRLLYVAMTRAEEELYMFGTQAASGKDSGEALWFDQLWEVCEDFDGVICKEFKDSDVISIEVDNSIQSIVLDEDVKKQIDALPKFEESGRVQFTASAISTYKYCERQYFYSEVMKLPAIKEEVITSDNVPAASVVGEIIHETLEKYQEGYDLRKIFNEAVKLHAEGKNTEEAWNILENYVKSDLYKNIPSKQLREYGFAIKVNECLEFNGFVDVIAFNQDGTLSVIDYKTGEPPVGGEEKIGYMYQLAIYKHAVEKLFNKKVKSAELHFLRNCSKVELQDEDLFSKVVELTKVISTKLKEAEFTCNTNSCGHCQYNYLCKKK